MPGRATADAGEGDEPFDAGLEVLAGGEEPGISHRSRRHRGQGAGARGGHAERGEIGAGGLRKGVAQARSHQLGRKRRAVGGDELAGQPRRRGDGNLLAEDGAHGKLEAVPGAWHAEAGPRGDERRHDRVFGELGSDGERIGGEIEDPPDARQDFG